MNNQTGTGLDAQVASLTKQVVACKRVAMACAGSLACVVLLGLSMAPALMRADGFQLKTRDKSVDGSAFEPTTNGSCLRLRDQQGRTRLLLEADNDNGGQIFFYDENGNDEAVEKEKRAAEAEAAKNIEDEPLPEEVIKLKVHLSKLERRRADLASASDKVYQQSQEYIAKSNAGDTMATVFLKDIFKNRDTVSAATKKTNARIDEATEKLLRLEAGK